MKADWCGTLTEQHRHKVQWLAAADRKKQGIKGSCGTCSGLDSNHGAHCKTHGFATRAGAVCSSFKARTAEDI